MSQWFNPSTPLDEQEAEPPVAHIYRRIAVFMWDFRRDLGAYRTDVELDQSGASLWY